MRYFRIIIITGLSMLFFTCAKRVTQEELIEAALEIKINQWKETEMDLCREKAMKRAEMYVDSFLLAISLNTKLDTIPKPVRAVKPEKPVFREKPDSLRVERITPK